ncbi:MAG: DNA polymerase III subunit delta [Lactobacillus sp.]|jgi:DNA polymerase-3 subunit delta'|nr:DNA polymerase III subunit delta [Lactobacillus sp.]MCH3905951.1 DNA polymerase III subunit delta [Lactobacillus sp.]MCH3990475.1 DNA polymerase III subunit delta [Lactobacillus sp.]MCH4068810.1 DNA polymerase III subunit delta [Lactobacillus sp.]MCI1304435.1 DNA polymerase III subunit delta [Lactobacillus sp.]
MEAFDQIDQTKAAELKRALDHGQLAHAYLFLDLDERRAGLTALWLACAANCLGQQRPDGICRNCQRILAGNFPDVVQVQPTGQSLSIKQVRPLKEELAKSPTESQQRFFIIEQAERLTMSAANALLNLLEEPVAPVVTILIANNEDQVLPTIRSRTQILNFEQESLTDSTQADLLAAGLSQTEIESLSAPDGLTKTTQTFYEEIVTGESLALLTAHELGQTVKNPADQKLVIIRLKQAALNASQQEKTRSAGIKMLRLLMQIDQMLYSNVSFRNCLDYLVLKFER